MKIAKIEVFPISIPFIEYWAYSQGTYYEGEHVITKIHTDDGIVGIGEGTPVHIDGEAQEDSFYAVKKHIAPALIGEDPLNIERIRKKMDQAIFGAPSRESFD